MDWKIHVEHIVERTMRCQISLPNVERSTRERSTILEMAIHRGAEGGGTMFKNVEEGVRIDFSSSWVFIFETV